jgi:hypothetical protein
MDQGHHELEALTMRARARLVATMVGSLALGSIPRGAHGDVHVGFVPANVIVAAGDTFTVHVWVLEAGASFNAFDLAVRFDPAFLSFEPTTPVSAQQGPLMTSACASTFHDFEASPDSLRATVSLLCNETFVTGPGKLYRVRFRAGLALGETTVSLGPSTEFYRAGLFVRPVHTQSLTVTVADPASVEPGSISVRRLELAPLVPNPIRSGGAMVVEFSLPVPDEVRLDVLDLQGRRVASRPSNAYDAGRHRLSWTPPDLANGSYVVRLTSRLAGSAVQRWSVLR